MRIPRGQYASLLRRLPRSRAEVTFLRHLAAGLMQCPAHLTLTASGRNSQAQLYQASVGYRDKIPGI